jgi:hypothetical protein
MHNSNAYAQFIREGAQVWFPSEEDSLKYFKGRIIKIDRLNNTVVVKHDTAKDLPSLSQKQVVATMENLEECADAATYSYFLTSMNVVSKPEILNYINWLLDNNAQYFYIERSIYYLKKARPSINEEISAQKYLDSIANFNYDVFKSEASFFTFATSVISAIKKERKNKSLFLLGQKASGKSAHSAFFTKFMYVLFLEKTKALGTKFKAAWTVIKLITRTLAPNGFEDSFAFSQLKFLFDDYMNLAAINFRLISLYTTFIPTELNIEKLPILFYLTKFFLEENKLSTDHLEKIFNLEKIDAIKNGFEIYHRMYADLLESFKVKL